MATQSVSVSQSPRPFNSNNQPNAAKMVPALRKLGYDNKSAVADLVDNSLDAGASIIDIHVGIKNKEPQIIIADNGTGMSMSTLDEALKFGSLTEKDATSDLGKFGMGLSTASLSLAKRCTVITNSNGEYFTGITDLDVIIQTNCFDKYLAPSTDAEIATFKNLVDGTGTVLILEDCDGLTTGNMSNLTASLRKELGRIFRCYIDSGRVILLNDKPIESFDPMHWGDASTEHVFDESFQHDGETVRVKLALLADDAGTDSNDTANMFSQGLYLMRNNREIVAATWLDIIAKHNDYNRVRGEVLFSGGLDEAVGIPFTKQSVVLKQSLRDKIAAMVKPELSRIRRDAKAERTEKTADEQQKIHDAAAKEISAKDKLLVKPLRKKGTRDGDGEPKERKPKEKNGGEHIHITTPQLAEGKVTCKFVTEHLGQGGQIYEAEMMGGTLVISYNLDHPFYDQFIALRTKSDDGRAVALATDFLVHSLASAEVRTLQDSDTEVITTFKSAVSNNLRTLLK